MLKAHNTGGNTYNYFILIKKRIAYYYVKGNVFVKQDWDKKSPWLFRLKTDGPLRANFRRIKQGDTHRIHII